MSEDDDAPFRLRISCPDTGMLSDHRVEQTLPMISSSNDPAATDQADDKKRKPTGKKKEKKRSKKKSFAGDGGVKDLLVVDDETEKRVKESFASAVREMLLPKDASVDPDDGERVARHGDECTTATTTVTAGDRNNRQQGLNRVKKHMLLGVNEILKSISRQSSAVSALILTYPLQTHLHLHLYQLAHRMSVPCLSVPDFAHTLKQLNIPATIGVALRPCEPESAAYPLLRVCLNAASPGSGSVPLHSSRLRPADQRSVAEHGSVLQMQVLASEEVYVRRDRQRKEVWGRRRDETSGLVNQSQVVVVGAKDNFFPVRNPLTSSPFVVVSHLTAASSATDRDAALMTDLCSPDSNVDQRETSSSTPTTDRPEQGIRVMMLPYRVVEPVMVQSSGKKRIRTKNTGKKKAQ